MGISKLTYGSGEDLFEISYKDDEIIEDDGEDSYTSDNFASYSFAAYQRKELTQFFEAGEDYSYNGATEENCIWRKWDSNNKTDINPGGTVGTGYFTTNALLCNDGTNYRIVTDLTDLQRVVWTPTVQEDYADTNINGTPTRVTYYTINTSDNQPLCSILKKTDPTEYLIEGVFIAPWLLYPQDNRYLQVHFNRGDDLSPWGSSCDRYAGVRVYNSNSARCYPLSSAMVNYDFPTGNNQNLGFYSDDGNYFFHITLSTNNFAAGAVRCRLHTEHAVKLYLASCGFKFIYKNKMYKPVAYGNIIVDYTDDMESESDWDEWHTREDHEIPSGPPKPPPAPDTDDPWHGVSYGSGGYGASPFCTSYAMTGAELTQLAAWGGKTEEQGGPKAGYDYMPSIISLVELPMAISGTAPSTVKFSRGTLGGYESNIVDTGVSGNPITAGTQRYNLGSVTLPLRMEARGYPFLDWDTVVELYMPFVGMFSLDPFAVLGKTITAFMDLDVLNGTICGYAYVTNNGEKLPVAYGSAQVGVSLPVTSDGAATARLALTTANAQLGSSFASSALQLGTMAAAGGAAAVKGGNAWSAMQSARGAGFAAQTGRNIVAGGASDAISGYATSSAIGSIANSFINWGLSLKQLQSSNNTQVNGAMGGGSFSGWSTPNEAYVKIIRPHAAPGAKASEYGNTHAYPYEANATLKDCKGLTFAVNPNVTGITKATDAERSQIAEILMGGVIA